MTDSSRGALDWERLASGIPRYLAIATEIRNEILQGGLKAGDRLPSEPELAARHRVSRVTIRQALAALADDRLVDRRRGIGTFVTPLRFRRPAESLRGLHEDLTSAGYPHTTTVLSLRRGPIPPKVAQVLGIEPGTHCYRIERLRSVQERPLVMHLSHIVAARIPHLDSGQLERRSLYEILESDFGLEIDASEQTIEAVSANARLAKALKTSRAKPILRIERLTWLRSGEPIEHVLSWYRGDAIAYQHNLRRNSANRTGIILQIKEGGP